MSDVFISYSRKDKDFVAQLQDALNRHEREAWLDTKDIPPTAEWLQEIYGAIERADSFVFVISPEAVGSEVCQRELAHAVEHHKRLIPVVRRDVDPKDVPDLLARLNWIFCREGDEFSQAFQTLLNAMATDLDHVRIHTRLLLKALEWEGRKRDQSLLLRGGELKRAEEWLTASGDKEPRPTPLMLQFLGASRQGATVRQRLVLGAVSLALLVAVSLGLAAFYQYREAKSQKESALARGLTAQSELLRSQQPHLIDRSVLLALESLRRRPTLEGSLALQRGLALLPKQLASLKGEKACHRTAISPDGALMAAWTDLVADDEQSRLWVWETESGRLLISLPQTETDYLLVAFTPDSKRLIILTEAGSWRVIAAADGRQVTEKTLEHGLLRKAALSPDGRLLAIGAGGSKKYIIIYELETWKELARLPFTRGLDELVFTPDGSQLAVNYDDGTIKLWQVKTATLLASFAGVYHTGSFIVSPDGQYLAAGTSEAMPTEETNVWVCHLPTKRVVAHLPSKGVCDGLAFSRNGLLMTATDDGVAVWRPQDGKEVFRVQLASSSAAALSADGRWLAVGEGQRAVRVYDLTTGKEARRLSHPQLAGVGFSPDGRWLYTWGQGGAIRWQFDGFQEVMVLPQQKQPFNPVDFAFSPDGRLLATSDPGKDLVYLWETATGRRTFSLDRLAIFHEVPRTHQVRNQWDVGVFSPDSRWLALKQSNVGISSKGETERFTALGIFNTATGKLVSRITGPGDHIPVSFRPDGQTLLTTDGDGGRKVWDLATGAWRETIPPPVLAANLQDKKGFFSPEGQWFCGVGEDQIRRVWEAKSGRELFPIGPAEPKHPKYFAGFFSHTGEYLAFLKEGQQKRQQNEERGDDSRVLVWEVSSGRQVASVPQPLEDLNPGFDPADRLLAIATRDNLVHVLQLPSGRELARLQHEAEVTDLTFSGDGRWLATASKDHNARVWEPASGQEIARLEHPREVPKVLFSPDGSRLATSCQDDQVRLWHWRLDDLMAVACARLARNFTREEWREYLGDEPYRPTCPDLLAPEK
jgi:WD40 repeat protein